MTLAAIALGMAATSRSVAQSAPPDVRAMQQRLVADLTGWTEGVGQTVPFSRSTPRERAAAASRLVDAFANRGLVPQRHRYRLRNVNWLVDLLLPPYRGTNVYVEIPATTASTEYVVVGAHYDSEIHSPGAIDNASGVALVFAVAIAVDRLESRARNFLFVFFDQEEDDEVGSRAFARYLEDMGHPVHSVHVVDLAGWDENQDGAVVIESPAPHVEPLYERAAGELAIPLHVVTGGGGASDNKSFMAAGFPTVGVFQDEIHPQLHRETDTYEVMDFDYLASMTRLVLTVMAGLALP